MSSKIVDLQGTWQLRNKSSSISVPAVLPGDTHSALLAAGKIADPYWADQELAAQWAGREDWIYERTFEISDEVLREPSVWFHAESLDTFATICINGRQVATTSNAFVRHRLEVRPFLRAGTNTITIELASAERVAKEEAARMPYSVPYTVFPVQSPHRNLVRKVQCHGGWDWGPCLMVAGATGPLYLATTSLARIEYVYSTQDHLADRVEVTVICEVTAQSDGDAQLEIELDGQRVTVTAQLLPGHNVVQGTVSITEPKLWWPNDLGDQPLYPLTVRIAGDEARQKIGLRTIKVVNEEDANGLSLVFEVNGVPIFCKGANWIPTDALPQRQTRAVLEDLLSSAVTAHMNMLRVWGGGQYESDDFYELCDEKGLLIWHDFMFSCALYPATPQFLEDVRQEVTHQVKRLRHHASIALWCGNNENVGALGWFEEARKNRDRYLIDYYKLNEGVVGESVRQLDPERVYWPSSPCGGPGDFSDCWHTDNRGDMHFWSVWHEGKPFEAYLEIKPRFCSEFGYQSFPSLETIRTYALEEDWNATSPVMEHHQRNPGGNTRITENFGRYFRIPDSFENFVYLSQVQQGIAIKTAVEQWRRLRPVCMGALYWQLNDLWPVCSWSSLEYGGKWKLLHHMARRFFDPLLISVYQDKLGAVEIWATSDRLQPVDAAVHMRVMAFTGEVLHEERFTHNLAAGTATLLRAHSVSKLTPNPAAAFLVIETVAEDRVLRNDHFFTPFKAMSLPRATVTLHARQELDRISVSLQTDKPALWTTLNADGIPGEFDDNCFTLLPGEPRILHFTPKHGNGNSSKSVDLAEFRAKLSVRHLRDTYR